NLTARFQIRHQTHEGALHVRRMLQHTIAKYLVEKLARKRQMVKITLDQAQRRVWTVVRPTRIHRGAVIYGIHFSAGFQHDFGKTSRAASGFKDFLPPQFIRSPARTAVEAIVTQSRAVKTIQLCASITIPLLSKTRCV